MGLLLQNFMLSTAAFEKQPAAASFSREFVLKCSYGKGKVGGKRSIARIEIEIDTLLVLVLCYVTLRTYLFHSVTTREAYRMLHF